jgi:hypothetical protein
VVLMGLQKSWHVAIKPLTLMASALSKDLGSLDEMLKIILFCEFILEIFKNFCFFP